MKKILSSEKEVRLIQILFLFRAFTWIFLIGLYLIRYFSWLYLIFIAFFLADVIIFLFLAIFIAKKKKIFYILAIFFLGFNILTTITDQMGFYDLFVLILDIIILSLVIIHRKKLK